MAIMLVRVAIFCKRECGRFQAIDLRHPAILSEDPLIAMKLR